LILQKILKLNERQVVGMTDETDALETIKIALIERIGANEDLRELSEDDISALISVLDKAQFARNDTKVKKELKEIIPSISKRILRGD
jgi:hypothetical protein